jgi:hypothetical protein
MEWTQEGHASVGGSDVSHVFPSVRDRSAYYVCGLGRNICLCMNGVD